jgi:hypothetical protein
MKKLFTLFTMIIGLSAYISAQETVLWSGETTPEPVIYFDQWDWVKTDEAIAGKYVNFGTAEAPIHATTVDNPSTDGVNTTSKALIMQSLENKSWWPDFLGVTLDAPISITENNRYLHFFHYRENLNEGFSVNINIDTPWEDPDKGTKRFDMNLSSPGVWEDVVVDLKWFMDNTEPLSQICILVDRNWSNGDEEATEYYFDELILSADPLQRGVVILEGTDILNCESQEQLDTLTFDTQNEANTYEIIDNPFTDSWVNADGMILKFHKGNEASWWQGMDIGFPGIHIAEFGVKQYLHVLVRTDTTCFIQLNLKDNLGVEHTEMFIYPKDEIDGDWFDLVMDVSSYASAIKGFTIRFDVRIDENEDFINNTPARDFYADEITFDAEEDPREGEDPTLGIETSGVNKMKAYSVNNTIYFKTENASRADLFDMLGRNITSVDLENNSGLHSIDVQDGGIYILRVASGSKVHTAKVFVR